MKSVHFALQSAFSFTHYTTIIWLVNACSPWERVQFHGSNVVSSCCGLVVVEPAIISRQASMVLWPRSPQVSNRLLKVLMVLDPRADRDPPLILRATTAGRIARSAALFSEGISGLVTKGNNSEMNPVIR